MSKSQKPQIIIKSKEQIDNIRESGKYLNELLQIVTSTTKAGVSLLELEEVAVDYISRHSNIVWAFKWYKWYPTNLCLSVNDCLVHWIPDRYVLQNWDLLKIDSGIIYNKWVSDSAVSVIVGWDFYNPIGQELIVSTKNALDGSLEQICAWKSIFGLGYSIWQKILSDWFQVVENLTWHGVGSKVHESPHVYNYWHRDMKKIFFQENMVIAIEPIASLESNQAVEKIAWNSWNLYTTNGDIWAQREYTIAITKNWYEILSGIL